MKSDVFEGILYKEDAQEIKKFLQEANKDGDRFVTFPTGKDGLKRQDIAMFKTLGDALENAHSKSTEKENHIIRSLPVAQKEIELILGHIKAMERENLKDRAITRSRDQGLSR
jgi:hypothetical protein